jgi:hypothetical protein
MRAQIVIGIALLSVAAIFFGISLPVLFESPCTVMPNGGCVYSIPSPSHEIELLLSLFGTASAICGIVLIVTYYRLEQQQLKNRKTDV